MLGLGAFVGRQSQVHFFSPPSATPPDAFRARHRHTTSLPPATSTVPTSKGAGVSAKYTAPVLVVAESVSLKPVAGASLVNRRFPRPTVTGNTSSRYSSIRPARCSDWAKAQLP